jgi:hypothetical protein
MDKKKSMMSATTNLSASPVVVIKTRASVHHLWTVSKTAKVIRTAQRDAALSTIAQLLQLAHLEEK